MEQIKNNFKDCTTIGNDAYNATLKIMAENDTPNVQGITTQLKNQQTALINQQAYQVSCLKGELGQLPPLPTPHCRKQAELLVPAMKCQH
jgi:hypothetical protein